MAPVSIANNHVLDYEYEALLRMIEVLRAHGILTAGAGANRAEASAPAVVRAQGLTIGLVACTDNVPGWAATDERPGVHYVPIDRGDPRAKALVAVLATTRERVDVLIVSLHWGGNWGYRPPAAHVPFARTLIDAGADIVFGHSCHVFRGIEIYKGRPILYAAGDFVDDYAVDEIERNDRSFVYVVDVEGSKIAGLQLYPTVIRNRQSRRALDPERQEIVAKMARLCDELGTESVWHECEGCLAIPIA